jgi:tetratricopeptide (TPR) repeat protein
MACRRKWLEFFYIPLIFSAVYLFFTGCAITEKHQMPEQAGAIPSCFEINTVPFYPQASYQCGPAALAMTLNWSGVPILPEDLTDEVFTPARKGSLQASLISAARRHGRIAYAFNGIDIMFAEVAAGYPVIILQNLGLSWYPIWHYSVIIGYDLQKKVIILRSGLTARKQMPFRVFKNTWARSNFWGLLTLKPAQLPAMAKEDKFLTAVMGLERSRQFQAAIIGYNTALKRWPGSLAAIMGLGNSNYAVEDLKGAESAFKKATVLHPGAGSAYNNLAQVLLEQGRKQDALEAARKAVAIGGSLGHIYKKTLKEIESTPN